MPNHVVDGFVVPDHYSGHVALELANTRAGWGSDSPREYLVSYDAVCAWAWDQGLISPHERRALASISPRQARAVHRRVLGLREALYDVVAGSSPGSPAWDVVDREIRSSHAASRLTLRTNGTAVLDGGSLSTAGARLPLYRAAAAFGEFLAVYGARSVTACGGTGCGWLVLDEAQRRRWCSMAICGNRAKARAHAARRRVPARIV